MLVRSQVIAAAAVGLFACAPAGAAQLAATSSTLQSVFAKATGGDTIKLTGGFDLTRLKNRTFDRKVTIDATAATFSDALTFTNVSNITVLGGAYGSATRLNAYNKGIYVTGGSDVSFINPTVTGFYTGTGIAFFDTRNVVVSGGSFYKLHSGININNVSTADLTNNRSIGSVGDGIDIVDSDNVVASSNSCTGSTPLIGSHPDCIQLWSTPGSGQQSNITLRDNYASGNTQGFSSFGSNGIGATNIAMINNRVDGLMPQGLACYMCTNSVFTGNILTSLAGASHKVNLNIINGSQNIVDGNVMTGFDRSAARQNMFFSREQLIGGNSFEPTIAGSVPEPNSWALMIGGFTMVGVARRHRQRYATA